MSNNVMNFFTIKAQSYNRAMEVVKAVTNDFGFFSLNKILPVPDVFLDTQYYCAVDKAKYELESELGVVLLSDAQRLLISKQMAEGFDANAVPQMVAKVKEMYKAHGYCSYGDWALGNWGPPCDAEDEAGFEDYGFCFTTKTHTFIPALQVIAERFSDVEFSLRWADEDYGNNCGSIVVKGKKIISADIAPCWDEQDTVEQHKWMKMACEAWGIPELYIHWKDANDDRERPF